MREKPIDVSFREIRDSKPRWWHDPAVVEQAINLIGGLALFGFVLFALNYGR